MWSFSQTPIIYQPLTQNDLCKETTKRRGLNKVYFSAIGQSKAALGETYLENFKVGSTNLLLKCRDAMMIWQPILFNAMFTIESCCTEVEFSNSRIGNNDRTANRFQAKCLLLCFVISEQQLNLQIIGIIYITTQGGSYLEISLSNTT